jgi:hypothetical protein
MSEEKEVTAIGESSAKPHLEKRTAIHTKQIKPASQLCDICPFNQPTPNCQTKPPAPPATPSRGGRYVSAASLALPSVRDFIAQCCTQNFKFHARASVLWDAYRRWCVDTDSQLCSQRAFAEAMKLLGFESQRGHFVIWFGLRLLAPGNVS